MIATDRLGSEEPPNLAAAARRLVPWGFLADPDLPDRPGPASLIVAMRERPTLRHYDPEVVGFWATHDGRGAHETITRATRMPVSKGLSWGEIQILDRLGESNGYLAFGGRCDADKIDDNSPRTAAMLRRLAENYDRHARREDASAELTEDFWR